MPKPKYSEEMPTKKRAARNVDERVARHGSKAKQPGRQRKPTGARRTKR
jgi:hypothetical protein